MSWGLISRKIFCVLSFLMNLSGWAELRYRTTLKFCFHKSCLMGGCVCVCVMWSSLWVAEGSWVVFRLILQKIVVFKLILNNENEKPFNLNFNIKILILNVMDAYGEKKVDNGLKVNMDEHFKTQSPSRGKQNSLAKYFFVPRSQSECVRQSFPFIYNCAIFMHTIHLFSY